MNLDPEALRPPPCALLLEAPPCCGCATRPWCS